MPIHKKPHLHTYLDRDNINDIYKLWNDGSTKEEIIKLYGFSSQSLIRILHVNKWKKHQRRVWGASNPPILTKEIYPTPHPFEKVKIHSIPGEGSKFTPDPAPVNEYCSSKSVSDKNTSEEKNNIEDTYKPLSKLDKWMESNTTTEIPELEHISVALENKLNQHEIEHRIEAIQICFDMLQEEFIKLKILIRE